MNEKNKLVIFQDKKIRRTWHNKEWYFSIIDVLRVLTNQEDFQKTRKYWNKLSQRLKNEGSEVVTNCHQLKLKASDGKLRSTDCANTKSLFRIIQSIPSKKIEPFKQWLAQVGHERIKEIENPELGQNRIKKYYELKGYPKDWIDKRLLGITVRQELTDEWNERGISGEKNYAILTNEISKATFGIDITNHKKIKNLNLKFKNQNLRDHMTNLELIFNMLGEASTTEIAKKKNSQGFKKNKSAAKEGGTIAGTTRKELEQKTGNKIVSKKNYLNISKKQRIN